MKHWQAGNKGKMKELRFPATKGGHMLATWSYIPRNVRVIYCMFIFLFVRGINTINNIKCRPYHYKPPPQKKNAHERI